MNRLIKIAIPVSILLIFAIFSTGAFATTTYPDKAEINSFVMNDTTSDATTTGYAEIVAANAIKAHDNWYIDIVNFNFDDGSSIQADVFYVKPVDGKGYEGYYVFERGLQGGGGIDKIITYFCPHRSPVEVSALTGCTNNYNIEKTLMSTQVIFSHVPGDGKLPTIPSSSTNNSTNTNENTSSTTTQIISVGNESEAQVQNQTATSTVSECPKAKEEAETTTQTPADPHAWCRHGISSVDNISTSSSNAGYNMVKEGIKDTATEMINQSSNNTSSAVQAGYNAVTEGVKDTGLNVLSLKNDSNSSTGTDEISKMSYDDRVNTILKYIKAGNMTEAGFVDCIHTYLPEGNFKLNE